jgi:hypothetical protein
MMQVVTTVRVLVHVGSRQVTTRGHGVDLAHRTQDIPSHADHRPRQHGLDMKAVKESRVHGCWALSRGSFLSARASYAIGRLASG